MKATQILRGRREGELLTLPSVLHMADILSQRCREPSWIRTSVASLLASLERCGCALATITWGENCFLDARLI